MKTIPTWGLPLFASAFALAAPAWAADEVQLKNGERILGKVTGAADGKLNVTSESVGSVSIPFDKIKSFSTEDALDIHFSDGTVVHQKVALGPDGQVAIEKSGVLNAQTLPITQIAKINPPPIKWTGDLNAGVIFTRGNSNSNLATVDFNAVRRADNDRITFKAGYLENRQKNDKTHEFDTTSRLYRGSLQYDYFLSSKWYLFAFAKGEKDAIAKLQLRFIAGAGFGQQWVETDSLNFRTEEGITWFSENFETPKPTTAVPNPPDPDNDSLASRLAYHADTKFTAGVSAFHDAEWYHGFKEAGDDLVEAKWGIRANLTTAMFTEARVELRWDATPAPGTERTDVRYILSAGISF